MSAEARDNGMKANPEQDILVSLGGMDVYLFAIGVDRECGVKRQVARARIFDKSICNAAPFPFVAKNSEGAREKDANDPASDHAAAEGGW